MALDLSTGILGLTDERIKITATDSTADHLLDKLVSGDSSVTFATVGASGTNQTLDIRSVGGGEVNTGSNVGAGTGLVFKTKVGVDLRFKSLIGGTNITVTNNTDDITIDATGGSDGNGIFDAANDAGGATIPAAFDAQMTDTFKLTGGKFGVDVTPTAKFQTKGDGTTTGVMVLFEDSAGTDRFKILDNGNVTIVTGGNDSVDITGATILRQSSAGVSPFTIKNNSGVTRFLLNSTGLFQFTTGGTNSFDVTAAAIFRQSSAGVTPFQVNLSTGSTLFTTGTSGDFDVVTGVYKAGGVSGISFSGAITNLTVTNGIVTAAS